MLSPAAYALHLAQLNNSKAQLNPNAALFVPTPGSRGGGGGGGGLQSVGGHPHAALLMQPMMLSPLMLGQMNLTQQHMMYIQQQQHQQHQHHQQPQLSLSPPPHPSLAQHPSLVASSASASGAFRINRNRKPAMPPSAAFTSPPLSSPPPLMASSYSGLLQPLPQFDSSGLLPALKPKKKRGRRERERLKRRLAREAEAEAALAAGQPLPAHVQEAASSGDELEEGQEGQPQPQQPASAPAVISPPRHALMPAAAAAEYGGRPAAMAGASALTQSLQLHAGGRYQSQPQYSLSADGEVKRWDGQLLASSGQQQPRGEAYKPALGNEREQQRGRGSSGSVLLVNGRSNVDALMEQLTLRPSLSASAASAASCPSRSLLRARRRPRCLARAPRRGEEQGREG